MNAQTTCINTSVYKPILEQLGPGDVDDGVMRNFFDTLALVLNITPFSETTVGASGSRGQSSDLMAFSSMSLSDQRRKTCTRRDRDDPIRAKQRKPNTHTGRQL